MNPVRRLLARRRIAVFLLAATLALRLLVPAGYMIGARDGRLTVELCSGVVAMEGDRPMAAMSHDVGMAGHDKAGGQAKADMPCAFAGLGLALLGAVDPILLVAVAAFIAAAGLAASGSPVAVRPVRLRPPLRGPPARL